MIRPAVLTIMLLVAGCGEFPRDLDGTLDRIRADRTIRVGLIAGDDVGRAAAPLLDRLRAHTGAEPNISSGAAETLLGGMERGELDMVVGRFETGTPWSSYVTLSRPLEIRTGDGAELHIAAALPNGENAWIGLVEREARVLAAGAQ